MATKRGFVQSIEVGRAGLVTVVLIHDDGTIGTYVIRDLDADPERFNERLSKLGILRDAMTRAEPVEIESVAGESGDEIDRATRISRDAIAPVRKVDTVAGLVVEVAVRSENGVTASGEKHDTALVSVLTTDLDGRMLLLDLQAPERLVAVAQLDMVRDAQSSGRLARFLVDVGDAAKNRIIAVSVDSGDGAFGDDQARSIDGFVESLSLIRMPFGSAAAGNFAWVRFTTAPPFVGTGNTVGLAPFTPETIDLLVTKGSLTYQLFEAGLRDNLRMRVAVVLYEDRPDPVDRTRVRAMEGAAGSESPVIRMLRSKRVAAVDAAADTISFGLAFGAELLAPLASASRPVWVAIARESLDHGPDGFKCTPGVPSSDLSPKGLRDLRIPYPAAWRGLGCFNEGVYRFQLKLPLPFRILVDCKPLCLFDADDPEYRFAHACLAGDHEVVVEIESWTCDKEFVMDVYRLR
jgi:hypothetical protein